MSKIVTNTAIYGLGSILPNAAGFFLLPVYTRYLSPSDYGLVSSMQVLLTIFSLAFTLAINRSIYRLYWDYKTEKERRDYLGSIWLCLAAISALALGLLFLLRDYVSLIYTSIPFYPYYVYVILTAYLSVFQLVPNTYLQIAQKAAPFVILSLMQFFVNTGFILWFIVYAGEGARGMLKGQTIGCAALLPLFVFMGIKVTNIGFKPLMIKNSLKFSLPMIPALLSAWVLNLSDRIFIERYFSLADVGIYSLGYKIAGLVLILSSAFYKAYEPHFYQTAGLEDQEYAKKQLTSYNNGFVMTILGICFLVSLFSREVIVLFLDQRYLEAYKLVPIFSLAYFVSQAGGLMNRSIYQEKKSTTVMFIVLFGALLNVALNFVLVPRLGVYGAAFAAILSFSGVFLVQYRYGKKTYFIPYNWKRIGLAFVPMFAVVSTGYFVELPVVASLCTKLAFLACAAVLCWLMFRNRSWFGLNGAW